MFVVVVPHTQKNKKITLIETSVRVVECAISAAAMEKKEDRVDQAIKESHKKAL